MPGFAERGRALDLGRWPPPSPVGDECLKLARSLCVELDSTNEIPEDTEGGN